MSIITFTLHLYALLNQSNCMVTGYYMPKECLKKAKIGRLAEKRMF